MRKLSPQSTHEYVKKKIKNCNFLGVFFKEKLQNGV